MANCNASKKIDGHQISSKHKHSQKKKEKTHILKICQVKGGGTFSLIQIVLTIVAKDNIFKLHNVLEHNDFACKLAIKIIHAMLVFPNGAIQRKFKQKDSSNKIFNINLVFTNIFHYED